MCEQPVITTTPLLFSNYSSVLLVVLVQLSKRKHRSMCCVRFMQVLTLRDISAFTALDEHDRKHAFRCACSEVSHMVSKETNTQTPETLAQS
jgi:hypothetical protein